MTQDELNKANKILTDGNIKDAVYEAAMNERLIVVLTSPPYEVIVDPIMQLIHCN